jgi:hypothetical protein
MLRPSILLLAGLASLGAGTGCCHCGQQDCAEMPGEPPLPGAARAGMEAGMLALAASVQPVPGAAVPAPPAEYRALAPKLCQCLACEHAPMADALDSKRQKLEEDRHKGCSLCGHSSDKQREFQAAMLLYSALEIRDQAAGQTLEWYYQLAGAEAKTELLGYSLERTRKTLDQLERMKKTGLTLPADIEVYRRQVVSLELEQTQNQVDIAKLNSRLRQAMAFHPANCWRFWPDPTVPLETEDVPDVEAAVHLGLSHRPQLLLLRYMIEHLDRDTLASARSLLGSVNPLLGMADPKSCKALTALAKVFHIQPGVEAEVEAVRRQLQGYLKERERAVEAEIRQAAGEVRLRRHLTYLARQVVDRWQVRIDELEKKGAEQMSVAAQLAAAQMESFKARGDVVREFIAWKIAAVQVKQAQGILPAECGYSDHGGCDAPEGPLPLTEVEEVPLAPPPWPAVLPLLP